MKLVDLTITNFMRTLGSDAPAPGGGSASALAGATGVSLLKMVTELTIGKKKYVEFESEMIDLRNKAEKLQNELLIAIDEDTESFNEVSAVFAMPKETQEEKDLRSQAMQKALKNATITPFNMMGLLSEVLVLTQSALGKSNTNAISDLGVAAVQTKAALQGAWLNVLINLGGIKDEAFVLEYKTRGHELLTKGLRMADHIFDEIERSL